MQRGECMVNIKRGGGKTPTGSAIAYPDLMPVDGYHNSYLRCQQISADELTIN